MEDEKEAPKDSPILEEEYVDMPRVGPQPLHIIVVLMEDIDDEDDLLDEFDAIFSSIDVESPSPIYEENVLRNKWRFTPYLYLLRR